MRSGRVVFGLLLLWQASACTPSTSSAADGGPSADGSEGTELYGEGGFPCGVNTSCAPTAVCCIDPVTSAFRCLPKNECRGVGVTCASVLDCPAGQVCCASFQQGVLVGCSDHCSGPGNFQICATDSECPTGEVCSRGALVHACAPPFQPVPFEAGFPVPFFDASFD